MMLNTFASTAEAGETQLEMIRDLMLAAGRRGSWMTLEEIAALTEIGEASVSAQLRHLRKPQHGCYRVEKRRRAAEGDGARRRDFGEAMWEYRVLPPGLFDQ
jgi:hypothetical protein